MGNTLLSRHPAIQVQPSIITKECIQSSNLPSAMCIIGSLLLTLEMLVATVMVGSYLTQSFEQLLRLYNSLLLPPKKPLRKSLSTPIPFVMVGDAAFTRKQNMMRLYPGRNLPEPQVVFNYHLSRARHVIENSFGILASRWRIFRRTLIATPDHAVIYTKAAIALHNFLHTTEFSIYCPPGFMDSEDSDGNFVRGTWREDSLPQGLQELKRTVSNFHSPTAAAIRDTFRNFFALHMEKLAGSTSTLPVLNDYFHSVKQ